MEGYISKLGSELLIFLAVGSLVWMLCSYLMRWIRLRSLPPGPLSYPVVGHLPYLVKDPRKELKRLKDKYGDIFSMYLGSQLVIVLGSASVIREALVKQGELFVGRPTQYSKGSTTANNGLLTGEGEYWKEQRRFSLSTLRDFGVGKMAMEPRIKEEISHFLKALQTGGRIADMGDLIRMSLSNVVCSLEFGRRFDYEDPHFQYLMKLLTEHVSRVNMIAIRQFFPWVEKIPGLRKLLSLNPVRDTTTEINNYLMTIIEEHEEKHEIGNERDFIDAWLTENKTNFTKKEIFSTEQLCFTLRSLFVAGSDTTANTLRWAILHLADQPEIQMRVQREIDDVIGREREPSIQDRDLMPYTEATIMEALRCKTTVPLSLIHTNITETKLNGYRIPKRTRIIPNLWEVHHDSEAYHHPEQFRPERFLNKDGKLFKTEQFMPFSLGKRMCLGEPLARMEAFLYFTSMLQNFTFLPPVGERVNLEVQFQVVLVPKPQRLQIIPR